MDAEKQAQLVAAVETAQEEYKRIATLTAEKITLSRRLAEIDREIWTIRHRSGSVHEVVESLMVIADAKAEVAEPVEAEVPAGNL